MIFLHKAPGSAASVAILAGAFNPPTKAHIALASAALDTVDEVLLAIPRSFPHKRFEGASLDQRADMLRRISQSQRSVSAAIADGGLFVEIAREAKPLYAASEIFLLCGRDAAERILTWDYGDPSFVDGMLQEFRLLVAPRMGDYIPPDRFRSAVRSIQPGNYDDCSSTRLREEIRSGGNWQSLVPPCIADLVEEIYA